MNRRLLRLARGSGSRIALHILLGLAVTGTYAGQGLLIARVLSLIFAGNAFGSTLSPLLAIGALQVVRAGLVWWREVVSMAIGGAVRSALRHRLYAHLLDLGPGYTARTRTGTVLTAMVDNVESLDPYYGRFLPQVAASSIGAIALVVSIFSIDPYVGLIVLVCALIVPSAPLVSRRLYQRASSEWNETYRSLYANSLDAVQGMTTLKAFNAHHRQGEQLHAESERFNRDSVRLLLSVTVSSGVAGLATSAGTALSVGVGAIRLADGAVSIDQLLVILLLTRECFRPLVDLDRAYHAAYSAPAAAAGIFALLDAVPDRDEAPAEAPDAPATGVSSPVAPDVRFDTVTFRYRTTGPPALDEISFEVGSGETVAIVGRSGAGKSTAVALLLRFFDPQGGTISVGGRDLRSLPVDELRSLVAVVAQDTYLFHGTVRHNLGIAKADATDAELVAATQAARAHEFISDLPQGYDTLIGERGLRLSGGERQRLAIARAVLKDAPILLLDEATSAIDSESEAAIQSALAELTEGRTTLVVAHRLSTVRTADRILVMDGGRLVESGAPDLLLASDGAYARLVRAQVGP